MAIVADELSNAAMARGMDSACRRTSYYRLRMNAMDWFLLAGLRGLGRVPAVFGDGGCLMGAVIQLKGAGFRYASADSGAVGDIAVNDIDLAVGAGEVVVVTAAVGLWEDNARAHG